MQATNSKQVSRVIVIGPTRETMTIGDAIRAIAHRPIHVETILTVVPPNDRKLERSELLPQLKEKLSGADASTMVISDIGDERPYKFEQLAIDVKANSNNAAIVLLTSKTECVGKQETFAKLVSERGFSPSDVFPKIDYVFHYTGESEIFPMMVDLQESRINYKNDRERAILVFESRPNYYSGFLTKLHEINEHRTHLLLARTYGEAEGIVNAVKQRFAGAILGMRSPDDSFRLLKMLRAFNKGLPVIMQSGFPERLEMARKEGTVFTLYKNDQLLFRTLGDILRDGFRFGDYIFRNSDGAEIGRAKNLQELCGLIGKIDGKVLVGDASRNDFSNWLYLHGHKDAAEEIKPMFTEDAGILRSILLRTLGPYIKN